MIRIRALNEERPESDSDDQQNGPSKEAQEAEALTLYHKSLQLLSESHVTEATEILEGLLETPYLQSEESTKCPLQIQLRLGCLKTLSTVYHSLNPDPEEAMRVLAEATKMDPENINLWNRMGCVAVKLVEYDLARYAFTQVFKKNPSHWGCIENLISLSYVLADFEDCLYFCAHGLGKDPNFIKGMVLRDHVLELHPYLKKNLKRRINTENLNTGQSYEILWKEKYLAEVRKLFKNLELANREAKNQELNSRTNPDVLNVNIDNIHTWSELCRMVEHLHNKLTSEGKIMRRISLVLNACVDCNAPSVEEPISDPPVEVQDEVPNQNGKDATDDVSQTSMPVTVTRRSSSDDKEAAATGNCEDGQQEVSEENTEKPDDADTNDCTKKVDASQKKAKRDLKWWQLEGKRRSQRVRGLLVMPSQDSSTKERSFGDKLKCIFPDSLMVLSEDERINMPSASKKNSQACRQRDNYFGTQREVEDVNDFVKNNTGPTIPELVVRLISALSFKTEMQWPEELASDYLQLYSLYRSFVSQPSLYDIGSSDENIESDSLIVLTKLELQLERTDKHGVDQAKKNLTMELVQIKEFAKSSSDPKFCARFGWFMARYYLSLRTYEDLRHDDVLSYLSIVLTSLATATDLIFLKIPTKLDNIISIEAVLNKQHFINSLENVGRINELYFSKKYHDVIEILDSCLQNETEETGPLHRFYLADSYFNVNKLSESLEQSLKIILRFSKTASHDSFVVIRSLKIIESVCASSDYVLSMTEMKQIIVTVVEVLIAHDQKNSGKLWTLPWCILHTVLRKIERQEAFMYLFEETTPSSIVLLKFAHKYLSRFNKCLADDAKLLLYTIEALVEPGSDYMEYEETTQCIEQAIFCLYCFPTKKSKIRHLTDHNSKGISLQLNKCETVYQYFMPKQLPDFDSYESINAEVETLFQRILTVIPVDATPIEKFDHLLKFMNDEIQDLDPESLENEGSGNFPSKFTDIYYLIADHHFKSKEWDKAIEFYTWDLTLNPSRLDSWAAIALAKAELINSRMNSSKSPTVPDIMSPTNVVIKCFRKALKLEPSNTKLRIEFGSFVYAMHANYSRYLRRCTSATSADADAGESALLQVIQERRNELLSMATECFTQGVLKTPTPTKKSESSEHGSQQEIWIHHYMLGKVTEKQNPDSPEKFLAQYELAVQLLDEQNAAYPPKISFNNSSDLAVEALEIYYRIHASVLTYIERHDYNPETEELLQTFLDRAAESPFMKAKLIREGESKKKKTADKESAEIKHLVEEMVKKVAILSERFSDNLAETSPPSHSSTQGTSSASESSAEAEDTDETTRKRPVTSFALSAFCDKIREEEEAKQAIKLRELAKRAKQLDKEAEQRKIEIIPQFKDSKYAAIVTQCVRAFEECLTRFSAHHKSYFRVSYSYFKFGKDSLDLSRDWLLGSEGGEKKKSPGLFADRKPNNFFNGIWRNPIDDLERTGSFSYHMSKTVRHLIEVLDGCDDHEMLAEVGVQLSKVPDPDKQYLCNSDREVYSAMAVSTCAVAAHRFFTKRKQDILPTAISIFGSYVKLQKLNAKENALGNLLRESYEVYLKERQLAMIPIDENPVTVTVEQAFRYFQHHVWATKIQQTDSTSTIAGRAADSGSRKSSLAAFKNLPSSIRKQMKRFGLKADDISISTPSNQPLAPQTARPMREQFHDERNYLAVPALDPNMIFYPSRIPGLAGQLVGQEGRLVLDVTSKELAEAERLIMKASKFQKLKTAQDSSAPIQAPAASTTQIRKRRTSLNRPTSKTQPPSDPTCTNRSKVYGLQGSKSPISDSEPYPILNFNTSPYQVRNKALSSPNDYMKGSQDPLDVTPPPKAHSHNEIVISSDESTHGVIDFSRSNEGQFVSPSFMPLHPEIATQYARFNYGQGRRRTTEPTSTSFQVQEKLYPLPPKKKRIAMNLFDADPLTVTVDDGRPIQSQSTTDNVEIIILD